LPEKIIVLKDKIHIIWLTSIYELVTNPTKAWERLKRLSEGRKTPIFKAMIISILMAGLINCVITSFVSTEFDFLRGIKSGTTIIFSLFISVYITAFINIISYESLTKQPARLNEIYNYTTITYSITFLVYAFEPLISFLFFYKAALIYTFVVAWIGTEKFMEFPNDNRFIFTTICGFVVIFAPTVISKLLTYLMPGLL
jgi:uncharacterized protein involved in response to NO